MIKNRFLPALVTGFIVAVLSIIPILQVATCCLFAPLAGFFGINMFYLQIKNAQEYKLKATDGISMGLMIGLVSGFFESIFQTLLILVSKANPIYDSIILLQQYLPDFQIPEIINEISREIDEKRFSFLLSLVIFFNTTIINSIFAAIGGLISVSAINKKISTKNQLF